MGCTQNTTESGERVCENPDGLTLFAGQEGCDSHPGGAAPLGC